MIMTNNGSGQLERLINLEIPEARFLNKSKFVPSSCLTRDPRVHAQLENKAGFFKHVMLEILGS